MKKEKSCGAIVYRDEPERQILLIKHKNGGHWAFPKGHVEHDETETQTALREIQEETGLTVEIDTSFRKLVTYSPKENVIKDVVYFAAKLKAGIPARQPEEVMEIMWATPAQALQLVTYKNDKEVLQSFLSIYKI